MSNSSLICYTRLSPNHSGARKYPITKITIHHMAGNLSVEGCGALFAERSTGASANYGIGSDGRIALYVDEGNRSWASSSADNDNRAVTIEVANDGGAPNWHASDKALKACIALCVDICKRNGIKKLEYTGNKAGNLTMHCMFAATACPGPYLKSKFPYIAEQVNAQLAGGATTAASVNKTTTGGFDVTTLKTLAQNNTKSDQVAVMQAVLNHRGYSCGTADGYFGAKTLAAVKKFQKAKELTADGICGPLTWAALLGA